MDGFGSADPKSAVMNQVRQEAAMNNARQLIEVIGDPFPPVISVSGLYQKTNSQRRKSMSIASRNASQNPDRQCRAARPHASRSAWRNTWLPGTPCPSSILRGYSRRAERVLAAAVCFKPSMPEEPAGALD